MSSSSPSSRVSFEISIHAILKRIKEKAEFQTNFATISIQIRYLQHILRLYDRPIHPGCISLDDFKHFLLERMNFISLLPTEIEYVFYFYDNELTGFLDYKNFLFQLYQTSDVYLPLLTTDAVNTFERIRLAFLPTEYDKYQQHNFLLFLIRLRERVICNVYGFCSRSFLVEQLFELIVTRGKSNADVVSKKDLANVIKFFDYRQDDTVFLSMFIRYLKSVMSAYRMRLVRTVFQLLSREGYIRLSDIRSCYHVTPNRTLRYRGKTFTRAVPEELLEYFFGHNFRRMNTNEILTWEVFNEYYQCISLSIESDELFELVLRHSWLIPNGKLDGKPMANDVEDVFERSLSSSYDSTTTKDELGISISPLASRSFDFGPVASRSISRSFDAHHSGSPRFVSTPGGTMVRTPVRTPLRHTIASLRSPPEATVRLDDEDRKGSSAFTPPVRREAFMGVSETKDIKI